MFEFSYDSVAELIRAAQEHGLSVSELVLRQQAAQLEKPAEEVYETMRRSYEVMAQAAESGLQEGVRSASGLTGGDANRLHRHLQENGSLTEGLLPQALSIALAVSEWNAAMGRIVAAPTAGSCGILPAALLTLQRRRNLSEKACVMALFTASGIGMVIVTTGLDAEGKAAIEEAAKVIPIVFSPNMSVGVNVTYKLLELAAKLLKDYDAEIFEMHHNRKVDAPSGTAIAMGKAIADARGQNFEEVAVWARQGHTGPRVPGSIGFAALRGGDVVGDHQVTFAGSGERIVISHLSSSRAGYAQGAVKAALWEAEKKPGLYSMSDVLGL